MANVHKDFHGCLSFGLRFLEENFGPAELEEYLRRLARNVYAPLIESLRLRGLPALHDHWNSIMSLEDADFDLRSTNDVLVLEVRKCPAIHHMKERGYKIAAHFCESTRIVNDEICRQAGYSASVEYDQENGCCVQKFRKEAGS
ncbi:MAG: hypothetical protein NTU88_08395 [Armatimonadetes bacterium]|nr:hypothetical protein [Armatimonadota bacterium]